MLSIAWLGRMNLWAVVKLLVLTGMCKGVQVLKWTRIGAGLQWSAPTDSKRHLG